MLTISKDRSIQLKGIAILMMLWFHLFNAEHSDWYRHLIVIGPRPLAAWLINACNPVNLFVLLGGYGLAYLYAQGRLSVRRQVRRMLRLYVYYWVTLAVFLTLGYLMHAETTPPNLQSLLLMALGWDVLYMKEMWFLFPYAVISILSPLLLKAIDRLGHKRALLVAVAIEMGCFFAISRYRDTYLYNYIFLAKIHQSLHFVYHFTLGAIFYRTTVNLDLKWSNRRLLAALAALVVLAVLSISSIPTTMVYSATLLILLNALHFAPWLERLLMELGRKSMPMWMIHAWLCYYLFQPQVYSLQYPIPIFLGLTVACYLLAIPIGRIGAFLTRRL